MWWLGVVPWGIEGVNRCRSYLRYQKTKKTQNLKIWTYSLHPDVGSWEHVDLMYLLWEHVDLMYLLYCPFLDEGSNSVFNILSKWRKRKTCCFFPKKGLLQARPCLKVREERCLRSDKAGEGLGEGEASPFPPRRENFEISLPSNGVSLHLRLNSIALSSHNTLQ